MRLGPVVLTCLLVLGCDRASKSAQDCPQPEPQECECKEQKTTLQLCPGTKAQDGGDFKLVYQPAKTPELQETGKWMEDSPLFGDTIDALNDAIALPTESAVLVADCGKVDAFYDPTAPGIVLCRELVLEFRRLFESKYKDRKALKHAVLGATYFSFLHELGHALVHLLDLPITGKEEDAVDQLATIVLIERGKAGLSMALSGAKSFLIKSENETRLGRTPFWANHSFRKQRYYAITCLAYGSDPKGLAHLVDSGDLPKGRAKYCAQEYTRVKAAWEKLLAPHAK